MIPCKELDLNITLGEQESIWNKIKPPFREPLSLDGEQNDPGRGFPCSLARDNFGI
jgi:hypothetical protein